MVTPNVRVCIVPLVLVSERTHSWQDCFWSLFLFKMKLELVWHVVKLSNSREILILKNLSLQFVYIFTFWNVNLSACTRTCQLAVSDKSVQDRLWEQSLAQWGQHTQKTLKCEFTKDFPYHINFSPVFAMVRIIKRDFALIDSENHSSFNKSTKNTLNQIDSIYCKFMSQQASQEYNIQINVTKEEKLNCRKYLQESSKNLQLIPNQGVFQEE